MDNQPSFPLKMDLKQVIGLYLDDQKEHPETHDQLSSVLEIENIRSSRTDLPGGFLQWISFHCPRLQKLGLDRTNVMDLTPLSSLGQLKELRLSNTRVYDLHPLENIASLRTVHLDYTKVSDLSPLSRLFELESLWLDGTNIYDLRALANAISLQTLLLSSTKVKNLSPLTNLAKLQVLTLDNTQVRNLSPLSDLSDMQTLSLNNTKVQDLKPIASLLMLQDLMLERTPVNSLQPLHNLIMLQNLSLDNTKVRDLSPLAELSNLIELSLNGTQVVDLSPLSNLRSLKRLSLDQTRTNNLQPLSRLVNLESISIDDTEVNNLQPLSDAESLQEISMRNLHLERIPEFCVERRITLKMEGTTIAQQPESLFRLDRKKILDAYYHQPMCPINEGKVIFLGESGVGKTHTILRIEDNGAKKDYVIKSTPGVDIRSYSYEEGTIIKFWDFGGQEIMQSMHRCFLTERTCYVVVVSNRDPRTVMTQAKKWLRAVAGFSGRVSVLLAVNQWNNVTAERDIDIAELKARCSQLTEVVFFSAKDDSAEDFTRNITAAILRQVKRLDSIHMELPMSWASIRKEIINLRNNYISLDDYRRICSKHGLCDNDETTESIRMWLLDWFNDMGVCFSYHKNAPCNAEELRKYKVLRPEWLTNGIYRIVNNGIALSKRGVLSKGDLSELLNSDKYYAIDNTKYESDAELNYILEVMRIFQFSYCISSNAEFVPNLLPGHRPMGIAPSEWGDLTIYKIKFTYLPISLLHRLMISMLDWNADEMWRFGVRYRDMDQTLVIEINEEEHVLVFSLYRDKPEDYRFSSLFHQARLKILRDYKEMRLVIERETVELCKKDSKAEYALNVLLEAWWSEMQKRNPVIMPSTSGSFRMFKLQDLLGPLFSQTLLLKAYDKCNYNPDGFYDLLNAVCQEENYATSDNQLPRTKKEIQEAL